MDFITGLPPSLTYTGEACDAIMVIVDRFTKYVRYIPVQKTINAERLADVFLERVVAEHGTPLSIVSDWGTVFTSRFWATLCHYLHARRRLSTSFHLQTNRQTE